MNYSHFELEKVYNHFKVKVAWDENISERDSFHKLGK